MGSLARLPRVLPPRRHSLLLLALALVTGLGAVVSVDSASAAGRGASTASTASQVVPAAAVAARATNPDLPVLPRSCRPAFGYMAPEPCRLVKRKPGAPLIVLWGDSHGWMMTPALRRAVAGKRVNVVSLLQGSCPVMDSDLSTPRGNAERNACDDFGKKALAFIDQARRFDRPIRVIVAMSWELYHNATDAPNAADRSYPGFVNDYIDTNARKSLEGTPRAFQALARMRVRTDVIGQEPMVYQGAPECAIGPFRCPLPRYAVLKDAKENNAYIRRLRRLLSVKGEMIRPASSLCSRSTCFGEYQGFPTYWDGLHIGQRTSYELAPHFADTVSSVLREARARRAGTR